MRRLATPAVLAALAVASPAEATVPDGYGFGSRSSAMAGAVTADVSDFSAGYYNPSGLVAAPGIEVAMGYMYNAQRLRVNGRDNGVDDVHGIVGGLVAPGVIFGIPFAFGIGVHLPDDGISYIKARRQGVPRWELYDTRAQLLYLQAGLAIRPVSWLELGAGLGYLSDTRGRFGIRGQADVISPFDSQLEHEVDADLKAVRYPHAGLRFILEGWGALGVTYRGQSNLDLQLGALLEGVVNFAGVDVPLLYQLEAKTIAAFTPQQIAFGLSFQRFETWHLNVDLTWVNWASYQSPTAEVSALLDVQVPDGIPVDVPDQPAPVRVIPPGFENRLVPRVGFEFRGVRLGAPRTVHGDQTRLVEIPLRAGYAYERSPVPEQRGISNLVDADRHTATVGVGITLNQPSEEIPGALHLNTHGAFSVLPERLHLKDSPADFAGDYRANGFIFGGGATMKVTF